MEVHNLLSGHTQPNLSFPRRRFWAFYAFLYDAVWNSLVAHRVSDALIHSLGSPQVVLDFGCGTGLISSALSTRGHRVTAVDPSTSMVVRAIKRAAADEYHVSTSIPDHSKFDSAIVVNVLQISNNPREILCHVLDRTRGCVIAVWPEDGVRLIDLARWEWQGVSSILRTIRAAVFRVAVGIPGILIGARRQSDPELRAIAIALAQGHERDIEFHCISRTGCVAAVFRSTQVGKGANGLSNVTAQLPSTPQGNYSREVESL